MLEESRPTTTQSTPKHNVREDGGSAVCDKLPHLKCVFDLASVFQIAKQGANVVTTAWFALAMFAPSRISEILPLPLECETE